MYLSTVLWTSIASSSMLRQTLRMLECNLSVFWLHVLLWARVFFRRHIYQVSPFFSQFWALLSLPLASLPWNKQSRFKVYIFLSSVMLVCDTSREALCCHEQHWTCLWASIFWRRKQLKGAIGTRFKCGAELQMWTSNGNWWLSIYSGQKPLIFKFALCSKKACIPSEDSVLFHLAASLLDNFCSQSWFHIWVLQLNQEWDRVEDTKTIRLCLLL